MCKECVLMAGRVFQKSGGAVNTSSVSRFKKDSDSPGGDGLVPCIVKSVVAGLASAGVLLLLVSIAATIYAIPEAVVNYVVIGISVLCLFIVGFSAAAVLKKNGLVIGIVTGTFYNMILFSVGACITGSLNLSPETLANFAVGGAVGALGGVVGINRLLSKKRKRK